MELTGKEKTELIKVPIKSKVSVFSTRRIGFSKKVSEDSVCDDATSRDEYPDGNSSTAMTTLGAW